MDSPWEDHTSNDIYHSDAQWEKLSSDFTNAGYREGITAGKEGALQEGFDSGFALTGAPLGRDLGRIRGISSAVLTLINKNTLQCDAETLEEVRRIGSGLGEIRFSDIVPPDLEAEAHAREHSLQNEGEEMVMDSEELEGKKSVEGLEDLLAGMSTGGGVKAKRPTVEDLEEMRKSLEAVVEKLGLQVMLS